MNSDRYRKALEEINNMATGDRGVSAKRVREIIRRAFHPNETCPQCNGEGEVPNTSRWCVFEKEGPMTIECLKFNKYVQNSNICRDCSDYTAKYSKMKCPSCNGKSTEYEEDEPVAIGSKHDFFGNIDLEDNPPTVDEER